MNTNPNLTISHTSLRGTLSKLISLFALWFGMAAVSKAVPPSTSDTTQATASTSQKNQKEGREVLQVAFDELKRDSWTKAETDNAALIADFIQHIMNDHDFDYVREKFGGHNYTQHSRGIPDGMLNLVAYVEENVKKYPEYTYDVKRMQVDGDYVTFHSHATLKEKHRGNDQKGFNIIDTWRIENGEIAEHWDAIQPINGGMRFFVWLVGGKVRNANGVF